MCSVRNPVRFELIIVFNIAMLTVTSPFVFGPVHTNPFSNENGAVLLGFQNDLHPHLSFSYRFRPSTLQREIEATL